MKQYIEKAALVAEIKKRYEYWREKEHNSHSVESETRMSDCQYLLLLLNSFEVKEVDLKKEIANQYESNYEDYLTYEEFADIAKHFYELGLKAQKGELYEV